MVSCLALDFWASFWSRHYTFVTRLAHGHSFKPASAWSAVSSIGSRLLPLPRLWTTTSFESKLFSIRTSRMGFWVDCCSVEMITPTASPFYRRPENGLVNYRILLGSGDCVGSFLVFHCMFGNKTCNSRLFDWNWTWSSRNARNFHLVGLLTCVLLCFPPFSFINHTSPWISISH